MLRQEPLWKNGDLKRNGSPREKPDSSYAPPIIYLMLGIEHMESMANCQ